MKLTQDLVLVQHFTEKPGGHSMAKENVPVHFGTRDEILKCDPSGFGQCIGKVALCWPWLSMLTFLALKLQTSIITNSPS